MSGRGNQPSNHDYLDSLKINIMEYKQYIPTYIPLKYYILFIPILMTYIVYYICNFFNCDEWYSLLGLNMVCNGCIDMKKVLKEMFWIMIIFRRKTLQIRC